MSKKKIFIFEFICSGGFNKVNIPTSLFSEGFGMLRSIISDFKAQDFEINAMLDYRAYFLQEILQADEIRIVNKSDNYLKIFKNLVTNSKFIFIIAPETSNLLLELTKIAKNRDRIILSTNINGIKQGTSKIVTKNLFKKYRILTPKTFRIPYKRNLLDKNFILHKFRKFKCPIVIKPEDGVGAESIHYFEEESQILNFFTNINAKLVRGRNYILQEFIKGRDLSLSLIGSQYSDINPMILSVNAQNISIKYTQSEYLGGYTPVEDYIEIIKRLSIFIKKLRSLKIEGYFGIDFIDTQDSSFAFIEINPRLTTSYIGLRNALNLNCAELILNSKFRNIIDPDIKLQNFSCFRRIDFSYNLFGNGGQSHEDSIHELIKAIPEFVTPPISLDMNNQYSSFIATQTKDFLTSKKRLNEIFQTIEKHNFKIVNPKKPEL